MNTSSNLNYDGTSNGREHIYGWCFGTKPFGAEASDHLLLDWL